MTRKTPDFSTAFRDDLMDLFRWRRDVRRFRRDAVPESAIAAALEAASLAPSVGNSQPWRWLRVGDGDRRKAVLVNFTAANDEAAKLYRDEKRSAYDRLKLEGLKVAPVQFAVFCDNDTAQGHGLGRQTMPETLAFSTVQSIHGFWLAARAHGIGVGWLSILDPKPMHAILDAPETWQFIAYLCVGWPEEDHDEPELERAGWEERRNLRIYDR